LANPARIRKTPVTEGVVREGIYRIISAIRKNDSVGFLELQRDGTIRAVPLNEASIGQRVPTISLWLSTTPVFVLRFSSSFTYL